MDKSKAFDLCKFSLLFRKLVTRINLVFVRIIIFSYINQFCNVSFNGELSSSFRINNGVGQGKVLAGFLYCFYCHDLFNILKESGIGCTITREYAGIFGYSDDDILLAPSVSALQSMLLLTENYCNEHGLKFSTDPNPKKSKTKCIAWLDTKRDLPNLTLCGNSLPWVDQILHLGNTLTNNLKMLEHDMDIKKARYIARNCEIIQEFYFADYRTKMFINEIYNGSWFGSSLWNLFSPASV